jgi:Tol biopolymer transport system component
MRKLALLAVVSATAALTAAGPRPKATFLFSLKDQRARHWALSADLRRVYYFEDPSQLYVLDRTTGKSSKVLGPMAGLKAVAALSPVGDRLAFTRSAEGGGASQLWTVPLDPATGLPNAAPRRVGLRAVAGDVTFSPDGKWIAIAVGTSTGPITENLVVAPTNGGPERVVAEVRGDISPIMWQKSDSLYFGLSSDEKENRSKNGFYRVGVSGGKPQFVLRTAAWGPYPGLSPDGRFIFAFDTTWDSVLVATAAGKRVDAYKPGPGEVHAGGWSADGNGIGYRRLTIRAVRAVDLSNGRERAIADSADFVGPVWSPDGRRVATLRMNPDTIVISDIGAGTRRSITIERAPGRGVALDWFMYWSPDGRFLAYRDSVGGINLIDPATSKVRLLAPKSTIGPFARWRSDSRAIVYANMDRPDTTGAPRKVEIREVTIDGQDHLLHTVTTLCRGEWCGKIVDDSLLSTWASGEYFMTNFRTAGAPRVLYRHDGETRIPTVSPNGRWITDRHQSALDQRWSIEVMHPDGSARRSVPLSFPVLRGVRNPWVSHDGAQLLVASADCEVTQSRACPGVVITIYRVDVATGKATAVASLSNVAFQLDDAMISNDGRTLAYVREVETRADVYALDFTELLKAVRP